MHLNLTAVPLLLQPYLVDVRHFTYSDSNGCVLPFYADGFPGIVYQITNGDMYQYPADKKLSPYFLYGQTVAPITLKTTGSGSMWVLILKPYAIFELFGIGAHEITDTCLDLTHFFKHSKLNYLASRGKNEKLDILSTLFEDLKYLRTSTKWSTDASVLTALEFMQHNLGTDAYYKLKKELHVSERTLERKFQQQIGVSPKMYSRIIQFQAAIRQLHINSDDQFASIAYELGYSDQSHMIRSFKEFAGLPPKRYLQCNTLQETI